jgi:hypothetical protein
MLDRFLLATITTSVCIAVAQNQSTTSLSVGRSLPINHAVVAGQSLPTFQNGFLLVRDRATATTFVWSRTGERIGEVNLTIPGVSKVNIVDVAAAANGRLAIAASATDIDGRVVSIIAWVTEDRKLDKVVRVSPFAARHVAFAKDGVLWAAGRVHDMQFEDLARSDVIRRYDPQGKLLGSSLPNTSFRAAQQAPAYESFLIASEDSMAFVSINTKAWVKMSLNGDVLGRWNIASFPMPMVTGAAVVGSDLFISAQQPSTASGKMTAVYRFNTASETFKRLDDRSVATDEQAVLLLGNDDGALVLRTKPNGAIHWVGLNSSD